MKGYHFVEDGKVFLVRCYTCGKENWAPAVATGQCAWCGSRKVSKKTKGERI